MKPVSPVSALSLFAMSFTLVLCVITPVVLFLLLRRRHARMAGPLVAGALAFYVSQMLIRIPLLQFGLPYLEKQGILLSRGFLFLLGFSLSAGLFEETARLGAFQWLLKGRQTWAVGVAFGIGHSGIEAILLTGITYVNNLVLSILYNQGKIDSFLTGKAPPEMVTQIVSALTGTRTDLFFAAGLERILTMAIHIALSLVVLEGLKKGRPWLYWLLAVLLHTGVNLLPTGLTAAGLSIWWSEAALLVLACIALVYVFNSRNRFQVESTDTDEAHKALEEGY